MADLHDHFFKAVFGQLHLATDLVRVIAPEEVVDALDLSSLVLAPTETVDASLANKRADLVFEARTRRGAPVVFQVEHQSRPDDSMALRLFFYAARVMQRWHHDASETHMPLVVSRVLYNGATGWSSPTVSHHLGPELRRHHAYGPTCPTRTVDVADIRRSGALHGLARLAIDALFVGTRPHFPLVSTLAPSIQSLAGWPSNSGDLHVIEAFLRYVCSVRPHADAGLADRLISLFPDPYDEMAQTHWEWSHERARQEGVELGRREGVELGRQEGVEVGRREGREEGVELGAKRALRETARRLALASAPMPLICEATGLSEREVREIVGRAKG